MSRRRGELTNSGVDAGWPHQVEVEARICAGAHYAEVHAFAASLSCAPRGGRSRYVNDRDYLRFAFATPENADAFQEKFGGRRLTVITVSGRRRDHYLPVPIDLGAYFAGLIARIGSAVLLEDRPFEGAVGQQCHQNARKFVARFGGRVVPGWMVNLAIEIVPGFAAHSVVELDEKLLDVTLTEGQRERCRFLRHRAVDGVNDRQAVEQYDWIVRRVGSAWLWPMATSD